MSTYSGPFSKWFARLTDGGRLIDEAGLPVAVPERGRLVSEAATLYQFGNSYDSGTGAGTTANGFASLIAAANGWTLTTTATDGHTLDQYVNSQFGSRVITAGMNICGSFLNDLRYYGPLPANREQFLDNFRAAMAYLAVPDTYKVHAGINSAGSTDYNPACTYAPNSAAWNGAGTVFKDNTAASRALSTSTSGASITATVSGSTVIVWYGQNIASAGLISILVDGQTFASGSIGTLPKADSPTGDEWMLACTIIEGLPSGAHTVVFRSDSTNPVVHLATAGFNADCFSGANVYPVGIPSLKPAHWNVSPGANGSTQATADSKPVDLYQLEAAQRWNDGMRKQCDHLRWLGLNVNFVDVSAISFQSVPDGDLHPLPPQHYEYARRVLGVMASLRV